MTNFQDLPQDVRTAHKFSLGLCFPAAFCTFMAIGTKGTSASGVWGGIAFVLFMLVLGTQVAIIVLEFIRNLHSNVKQAIVKVDNTRRVHYRDDTYVSVRQAGEDVIRDIRNGRY